VHLAKSKTVGFLKVKVNIVIWSEKLIDLSLGKTLEVALR